jgi:hypothetical protein
MRHGTRRRQSHDPLQALAVPTWLVVRDQFRTAVESRRLEARTDLRHTLTCERDLRIAAGWRCEEIGRYCAFFFCERGSRRVQVGIERYHPDEAAPMHSDPG